MLKLITFKDTKGSSFFKSYYIGKAIEIDLFLTITI